MSTRHGQWFVVLAGIMSGLCYADTVYLSDGTEIDGTILEEKGDHVVIRSTGGTLQSIKKSRVEAVVREPKVEAPKPPPVAEVKPAPAEAAPAVVKPTEAKTAAAADAKPTAPADAKPVESKPADAADAKPAAPKPADPPAEAKPDEKAAKPVKEGGDDLAKKDGWTPPPGLPGFPEKAKRMSKDKEEKFMAALERMATVDEAQRGAAKNEIAAMGTDALPYVVAGLQHVNVDARTSCMYLVGQLSGRSAVKQVIEVFYSAMPEKGEAATYQVPFIRAIKATLPSITGQSFINVEPDKSLVQDGLKKYIEWYEDNFDRIPAQLGEPTIEATDPEYDKKLKAARKLNLAKKSWPRPPLPADIVSGNNDKPRPTENQIIRSNDRNYGNSLPKLNRDDALRR